MMASNRREWGRVRKLPSGRWQARYPGPDGVLRSAPQTFETRKLAASWLADKQAEINRDEWINPDASKVLLSAFGSRWIAERDIEATTRERYEDTFRLHIDPYLGALSLNKITEGRVRTWRKALADNNVGKATQAQAYRVLRAILATAADDRRIRRNPCRIKNGGKDESAERAALSVDEVFAIADAIRPRYRVLVLFAAFTSLRFGELAALQQIDIDMAERVVSVRKSQAELRNGKRVIKGTKSAAGIREVAIPQLVLDGLKGHLSEHAIPGDEGYVFVGPRGGRLRRHNFRKVWLAALAGAKIKKTGVHFHDLRHTGNDLAAKAGASTKELMTRMGHSSVRAALIYQHASRERDREIAEQMNDNVKRLRERKGHAEDQSTEGHAGGTTDENTD